MTWRVIEATGSAGDLHAALPDPSARLVRVCSVTAPALVLGSAQRLDAAAAARASRAGLEVVRRRSGGGAVVLTPASQVWVDVALPRTDELWVDDVGQSGWWLGDAWARVVGGAVHKGAMVRTPLSDRVCFAGLGPGEVTVEGAKVVGVSQRRTREGAVFQCTVPLTWDPAPYVSVLGLSEDEAAVVAGAAVTVDRDAASVVAGFVAQLP